MTARHPSRESRWETVSSCGISSPKNICETEIFCGTIIPVPEEDEAMAGTHRQA
jgi:hypothetical protein